MTTNVKVRAKQNGHDGTQYRHAGEVFEVHPDRLKDGSTWFDTVPKDAVSHNDDDPEPPAE